MNSTFTHDNFYFAYFKEHGEDNMLTLFFKKLCIFLNINFEKSFTDCPNKKDFIYEMGRLLLSMIG